MTQNRRQFGGAILGTLLTTGWSRDARAQTWPTRPVRFVVPYGAGGGMDTMGRLIAGKLSSMLGKPCIIQNKPGAGTLIGTEFVFQAPPDGYTLLFTTNTMTTAYVFSRPRFDPTEFASVALIGTTPYAAMVARNSRANTLNEFLDMARAKPNRLFYGTPGPGSTAHFLTEYLNLQAGCKMQQVPYGGTADAVLALVAGDVQFVFSTITTAGAQIADGSVKILAYSGPRPEGVPEAPTVREASGYDFDASGWWGIFAPEGTPMQIRSRINEYVRRIVAMGDIKAYMHKTGATRSSMTMAELDAFIVTEIKRWREVAMFANMTVR